MRTRILAALAAVTVVTTLHGTASGQGATKAPTLTARPLQPTKLAVALQPITVDPALKPALTGKRKFDPAALAANLRVVNGTPLLKIKRGREYPLMPLGVEPKPSASLQMTALPPQLLQYKKHIESPIVAGRRIGTLIDRTVRNEQTAIRDQGGRGTCTAFASMAAMEGWAKRNRGKTLDLSENHAFDLFMKEASSSCTTQGGYTTWKTGVVLSASGACFETLMPYSGSSCPASVPAACSLPAVRYRFTATQQMFTPKYGGTGSFRADNTNLLEAFLKGGMDIVYGVDVAGSDWSDGTLDDGVVDVQVDSAGNPVGGYGGHAMLLVGYNREGRYFVFKNSWGADSGHDGYVHLSYDYVQVYGKYGYAVAGVAGPNL